MTEPSLILIDRASYHQGFGEGVFFPKKALKSELQCWLKKRRIKFDPKALKSELVEIATKAWKAPFNVIEELAEEHGRLNFKYPHRIVYLPPYHPEYNAIEIAWSNVKRYSGNKLSYSLSRLCSETIQDAFQAFTPQKCSNIINMVLKRYAQDYENMKDLDLANM